MGARGIPGSSSRSSSAARSRRWAVAKGIDAAAVARALRAASDTGYAAVRNPQEGTMLTVARTLAERRSQSRASAILRSPRRSPNSSRTVRRALASDTPNSSTILKEAGVVDAGGAGVLEVLRGIAAHVRRRAAPRARGRDRAGIPLEAVHLELSRYRYCTSFFVEGRGRSIRTSSRASSAKLGDSLLVVGGPGAVKVHVHTDDPGAALALATSAAGSSRRSTSRTCTSRRSTEPSGSSERSA